MLQSNGSKEQEQDEIHDKQTCILSNTHFTSIHSC